MPLLQAARPAVKPALPVTCSTAGVKAAQIQDVPTAYTRSWISVPVCAGAMPYRSDAKYPRPTRVHPASTRVHASRWRPGISGIAIGPTLNDGTGSANVSGMNDISHGVRSRWRGTNDFGRDRGGAAPVRISRGRRRKSARVTQEERGNVRNVRNDGTSPLTPLPSYRLSPAGQ